MKLIRTVFILLPAVFAVHSCTTPDSRHPADKIGQQIAEYTGKAYEDTATVPVYFATNRNPRSVRPDCSNNYFGIEPSAEVRYGVCNVNVPRAHAVGALDEKAGVYERDTYFLTESQKFMNSDEMMTILGSSDKDLILFVHGFNVQFNEAVFRSAQMLYDAKFQGDILLYTWPAGSGDGFLDRLLINRTYELNKVSAEASRSHFRSFLIKVISLKRRVHLVIHSMGHQVVLPVINNLVKEGNTGFITEMVLNAPDFSAQEMAAITSNLVKSSRRITLYCSPGDNALNVSEMVNSNKRAGSCTKLSGIDVVNVNQVDSPVLGVGGLGHGYYSGRAILTDLYQVLFGIPVEKRLFIQKAKPWEEQDWVLRR